MLSAIRHALFGLNRAEQEAFIVPRIYRLSAWIENADRAERAAQTARAESLTHVRTHLDELTALLAAFDAAKSRLTSGASLPRADFAGLRLRFDKVQRAMDAAAD